MCLLTDMNDQILLIILNKMEELKPYIVEFDKSDIMKLKIYLLNCILIGGNYQ